VYSVIKCYKGGETRQVFSFNLVKSILVKYFRYIFLCCVFIRLFSDIYTVILFINSKSKETVHGSC